MPRAALRAQAPTEEDELVFADRWRRCASRGGHCWCRSVQAPEVEGAKQLSYFTMRDEPRVLFATGIESGTHDSKAGVLATAFANLCVPEMHVGVTRAWKRNSLLRSAFWPTSGSHMLRLVALVLALVLAATPRLQPRVRALAALSAGASLPGIAREGLAAAFIASFNIQREALRAFAPDVAVGSSWGGAVLLALREAGEWTGPLVLIAPAHYMIRRCVPPRLLGRAPFCTGAGPLGARGHVAVPLVAADAVVSASPSAAAESTDVLAHGDVLVIHGNDDPIIPLSDSTALCRASGFRLLVVPAGGHRCTRTLEPPGEDGRSLLAKLVTEQHELAREPFLRAPSHRSGRLTGL